ncbi:MAG: hypothetical protein AAFY64_09035, partial [Pseudomonadota bacterium]
IGRLVAGDDVLKPRVELISDEHLQASDAEKVQARLDRYVSELVAERLKPLVELSKAEDVNGLARGIGYRLYENLGTLRREDVAQDIRALDQPARSQLRRYGVRFGAFNIFFPLLLKPAPTELLRVLWTIKHGPEAGIDAANVPEPPRPGLTSVPVDAKLPAKYYAVSGFHICGPRAVRIDMLERLADQIRALLAYRDPPEAKAAAGIEKNTGEATEVPTAPRESAVGVSQDPSAAGASATASEPSSDAVATLSASSEEEAAVPDTVAGDDNNVSASAATPGPVTSSSEPSGETPPAPQPDTSDVGVPATKKASGKLPTKVKERPAGSTGDGGFIATSEMMSILGCSADELGDVLKALGFRSERRPKPDAPKKEVARSDAAATQQSVAEDAPPLSEPLNAGESVADNTTAAPEVAQQPNAAASAVATPASGSEADAAPTGRESTKPTDDDGMMTVWRPRRRHEFAERGPRRRGRAPDRSASSDAAKNASDRGPRRDGSNAGRPDHRKQNARSGPSGRSGGDAGGKGGQRQGGKQRGDRRGNGPQRGGGQRGPKVISAAPKRSDKSSPSADSPFAALSALKETLERSTDK